MVKKMRQHTILRRINHLRTVSQRRQLTCENVNKSQLKSQYDAVVIGSGLSFNLYSLEDGGNSRMAHCLTGDYSLDLSQRMDVMLASLALSGRGLKILL